MLISSFSMTSGMIDVQVACYMCTLTCLRVATLEQCLLAAAQALGKGCLPISVLGIKRHLLGMLRDYLYARAVGRDAPLPDSCPVLVAEACFDAGCPLAAGVGLKTVSMIPYMFSLWAAASTLVTMFIRWWERKTPCRA